MHGVVGVEVAECGEGLAEELECLCLADDLRAVLIGEESAVLREFHDHIDDGVLDDGVPELDDVRVVDCGVQVDFPLEQEQLILAVPLADVDLRSEGRTTLTA